MLHLITPAVQDPHGAETFTGFLPPSWKPKDGVCSARTPHLKREALLGGFPGSDRCLPGLGGAGTFALHLPLTIQVRGPSLRGGGHDDTQRVLKLQPKQFC